MKSRFGLATALLLHAADAFAQPQPAVDAWLGGALLYPRGLATNALQPDAFTGLRAEQLAEQLKVRWQPTTPVASPRVVLHFSADAPGHWPARDWRTLPMLQRGVVWEATLPVDDLDVPLVYFVSVGDETPAWLSPLRVVAPRLAGMAKPSRVFWPFLDGFEDGLAGWELISTTAPPLKTSPLAHDGNAAMAVTLPPGAGSVTVSTTRVRGWHYSHQLATGLRVWLRAPGRAGVARFSLHAQSGTTNAVVIASTIEAALDDQWRKVDLAFSSFPNFPVVGTDRFTIQFSGEGPTEFLVDDVRLLGRWRLPGE